MKLRDEVKFRAPNVNNVLLSEVMDIVDDILWERFDRFKLDGIFKVKIWKFITLDISSIVEQIMIRLIGPREVE